MKRIKFADIQSKIEDRISALGVYDAAKARS